MLNTQRHTQIIPMTDAVVARGQRAWGRIKATAAEQRELWREVGEALLVGRRLHKSDKLFGQWVKENGFDDMHRNYRSAAMWLAQNWAVVTASTTCTSDPIQLQKDFNEQKTTSILPADLAEVEAEKVESIEIDQRSAERVAKVINRAKANDEGSEIAKRHVEALAKKHNTTPEKLEEAVKTTAPAAFFRFTPEQLGMLDELKQNVIETVHELELAGLSREAIAAVFINVAKTLKEE